MQALHKLVFIDLIVFVGVNVLEKAPQHALAACILHSMPKCFCPLLMRQLTVAIRVCAFERRSQFIVVVNVEMPPQRGICLAGPHGLVQRCPD